MHEFTDEALADHERKIAERAWDEGYWQGINGHTGPGNPYAIPNATPQATESEVRGG